jgi:hypothetical protein
VDIALTIIFVIDFSFRLSTAQSKRRYLLHDGGVFDFLGCLPATPRCATSSGCWRSRSVRLPRSGRASPSSSR